MVILAGSGWGMLQAAKIEECYRQMRYLRKLIFRIRSEIRYSRRVQVWREYGKKRREHICR